MVLESSELNFCCDNFVRVRRGNNSVFDSSMSISISWCRDTMNKCKYEFPQAFVRYLVTHSMKLLKLAHVLSRSCSIYDLILKQIIFPDQPVSKWRILLMIIDSNQVPCMFEIRCIPLYCPLRLLKKYFYNHIMKFNLSI